MNARTCTWIAWTVWIISLTLSASSLLLLFLSLSSSNVRVFDYWAEHTVIAVTTSTVGAVVVSRRPQNPIGWLFCAESLFSGVRHFSAQYAIYALLTEPGSLPGGEASAWISAWIWVFHIGAYAFLGLLFPDGRLPSKRWRWVMWFGIIVIFTGAIAMALLPGPVYGLSTIRIPLGIDHLPGVTAANGVSSPVVLLLDSLMLAAITSLFVRFRRTRGIERQNLKLVSVVGAAAVGGAVLKTTAVSGVVNISWVYWVGFVFLMVGLGTAATMLLAG